jgi:magnesium transporter
MSSMSPKPDWKDLAKRLNAIFEKPDRNPQAEAFRDILHDRPAADIALAMEELNPEQSVILFEALDRPVATDVLSKLEPERRKEVLSRLDPDNLPGLIEPLPPRDAAAILTEAPKRQLHTFLKRDAADTPAKQDVHQRLNYPEGTAGRIMTTGFVRLNKGISIGDALGVVRQTDPNVDIPGDLYVVESEETNKASKNRLLGVVSIRDLLMCDPGQPVEEVMTTEVISVAAGVDEEDAAALLSKYKFTTLPVTDKDGYLVGVIPADDLMPVVVGRLRHLYSRAVGTDAETMERLSPFQAAKLRVPWLLGTMAIELGAGLIISHFDAVLQKVILLASFMPVISAVSGNVGLQAAAITVRALDTRGGARKNIWTSLKKEAATSFLMAMACGLILGAVGAIWAKHLPFGVVIGVAITCSMLTAGFMGTVIPMVSKRFGFDPATTAGPFETAFQDIVGFAVFLGLATLLQHWMT